MERLVLYAMSAYAATFVVASSSLFEPFRLWFIKKTPKLKIGNHKHFIECRMCVSAWASIAVCNYDWKMILPTYGLAYWLATQER